MARTGLGKGLGALISAAPVATSPQVGQGERVSQVPLGSIVASPLQPRKEFGADALQELVASIRQHGIIQPLVVRAVNGKHELIAGERRWRAAHDAGLTHVPVITRSASDLEVLELSLIENLQRADLNPIEEAQGYARLAQEFGLRQEDIAQKVGRSRAAVANATRLLELHPQIQTWVTQGILSVGHAKALLAIKESEEQLQVANAVLRRSATVRATERMIAKQRGPLKARRRNQSKVSTPATVEDLRNRLQEHLGTRVTLHHGPKSGRIEIEYYGDADLSRIVELLGLHDAN